MMSWKSSLTWSSAKKRANYLLKIREFFYQREIIEVETPQLSHGTITDVHLDSFSCQFDYSKSNNTEKLYLQTSPEFAMKRLIASGYGSIYQLCKAYRHEEEGRFHNPEFSILEWYRIGLNHFELMDEVNELLMTVLECAESERITYQQVFIQYLDVDPLKVTLNTMKSELIKNNVIGDWIEAEQNLDVLLQVAFTECIENKIGLTKPCFIYNYPKSQASLAAICDKDHRVAQRFECYYKGVELANGFNELTDAKEQTIRFINDNEQRKQLGKDEKPIDLNFIKALEHGLPQCSGVAVGVDRLLMLALNEKDISSVMSFSTKNS